MFERKKPLISNYQIIVSGTNVLDKMVSGTDVLRLTNHNILIITWEDLKDDSKAKI